jgi:hypothetical protein
MFNMTNEEKTFAAGTLPRVVTLRLTKNIFDFGLTAKLSPKAWEDIFDPSPPSSPSPSLY